MPSEVLLMFLMSTNMIAGVLILPAHSAGAVQLHTSIQNFGREGEQTNGTAGACSRVVTKAVNMSRDAMVLG